MMRLEEKVIKKFTTQGRTLAIAESCTGGLLGDRLTNVSGASKCYLLGIIAYDNAAKTKLLGVSANLIKKHGAVSPQVALKMAQGVRQILKTNIGLAITGIAGPSGGSHQKPVGLVYIALSNTQKTVFKKFLLKGSRLSIKHQAADSALKMLAK